MSETGGRPASPSQRLAASGIDFVVLYVAGSYGVLRLFGGDQVAAFLPFVALCMGYFFSQFFTGGRTIGKFVARTRVLSEGGREPSAAAMLVRSALCTLSILVLNAIAIWGVIAIVGVIIDCGVFAAPERLSILDRLTRTLVLDTAQSHRSGQGSPSAPHRGH